MDLSHGVDIRDVLQERILVFDGAMGTQIQNRQLSAEDFGGPEYEGCNEHLVLTRPDVIESIHRAYLDAGADVIETDTFGATPLVLAEYHLEEKAFEINRAAAAIARKAADEFSSAERPRFVAGSMGPTTKSITVTGGVTFDALTDHFCVQAKGLLAGGVDVLLLETCQDTRNVKAGLIGIRRAFEEAGKVVPMMVSGTIEAMGTMLAGQGVEALYASVEHAELLSIGLNCATGPTFMTDHIRSLAEIAQTRISCIPNAGLPDEEGRYNESPQDLARVLLRFVDAGWINIVGGCCGTNPKYIEALAEMVEHKRPRPAQPSPRCHVSGIEYLEITEEKRPVLVGERTNVIGSRKFKGLIAEGRYEEAAEIGRKQVRAGSQILDVCLADPDRNEREDMVRFLEHLVKKVKAPLMIDSTDAIVIEEALKLIQGKSLINSINLEDGEERFQQVIPLARRYGAALVVGCIDEDPEEGMAVTAERKRAVAQRSYEILTQKYGVKPQDIVFDPLVFPCGTGDEKYIGSAEQTLRGIEAIKKALPDTRTILGISNVSFGLPGAGREVLNAVFLYHCTKAGLDLAIVNTEKLERYASIPEEERKLSEDLIFNRGDDPIGAFAAFYRDKKREDKAVIVENRTLEERLAGYIIEGSKEGLIEDLELARAKYASPLEIINGPLMAGMDEVGRLFNNNELIVAEVLQSAESMKAAVSYLESFMEKADAHTRGKVILATVKGDVHDIGKNLVEIIFSNNGYHVINLGIKVPPEEIIKACRAHRPDIIGLSGLLVKSAQQMVLTAEDLKQAGVETPMLVGGAALSNRFSRLKIAPEYDGVVAYAKDAMSGLELAHRLMNPERRAKLVQDYQEETTRLAEMADRKEETKRAGEERERLVIRQDHEIPTPPDGERHVLTTYPLEEIFSYLNLQMLMGKHLGVRGNVEALLHAGEEKAAKTYELVRHMEEEILERNLLHPRAVFQFFPVRAEGDALIILDGGRSREIEQFVFPRQSQHDRLCLSDFVSPDRKDYAAFFVTTCGDEGLRREAERYKEEGEYIKSHTLLALAIESAEAFAELLHEKIRSLWGIADPPGMTMKEKLHAKYRGIRVSFGYPACPRLEDQKVLFRLLEVEKHIAVTLTDEWMMDPEASVSALVLHHPQAKYFNVSEADVAALEEKLRAGQAAPA